VLRLIKRWDEKLAPDGTTVGKFLASPEGYFLYPLESLLVLGEIQIGAKSLQLAFDHVVLFKG
jgi:hypothetical protein